MKLRTAEKLFVDRCPVAFPIKVGRAPAIAKIYQEAKPAGTYYRVVYHANGTRYRKNFATLTEAKEHAGQKARELAELDGAALRFSGDDRHEYAHALKALTGLDVSLSAAAHEYKQARELLNGTSLVDAARFYARHHGGGIKRKSVAVAVDEMIDAKRTKGVSELYLADLRYRLGTFKAAFHCDVSALVPDDVSRFLNSLKLSPRSYNNFLWTLRTLFRYAQQHDWLSKEADLLARVEERAGKRTPVEIFSPAQLAVLLNHAPAQLQSCIALAAFAGVRVEEILRLDWADVDRRPGFIEVAAHKAKTASRRIVPISDNLAQWLSISPRSGDRIWPYSKPWFFEAIRNAARAAKVKWAHNAPRHSYISYRLARLQDVNRIALEAGTSPKMIYQHYRELVTPAEAKAWFEITPELPANVLRLQHNS
jgi:integrase